MNKKTKKKNSDSRSSMSAVFRKPAFYNPQPHRTLEMESKEIFEHFPNLRSMQKFYYEAQFLKYKDALSEIDGYDSFSLSEKMDTRCYFIF